MIYHLADVVTVYVQSVAFLGAAFEARSQRVASSAVLLQGLSELLFTLHSLIGFRVLPEQSLVLDSAACYSGSAPVHRRENGPLCSARGAPLVRSQTLYEIFTVFIAMVNQIHLTAGSRSILNKRISYSTSIQFKNQIHNSCKLTKFCELIFLVISNL